jgi:catecholate siderophore receptor
MEPQRPLGTMKKKTLPAASPLAAALAFALASPAFAAPVAEASATASTDATADAAAAERKPTELEGVEVTGQNIEPTSPKLTQPLLDTPQTISVIESKVINQRAATTLREVLRNVSGISLVAGEGGGQQGDNLRIRGFGAGTDLFVDGMRDPAQYSRDPFNVEQVEVVKGPASAQSGRGSTGGSVNLVSKAPRLRDFANASLLLGTDATRRVQVDLNEGTSETTGVRVAAMHHEADFEGRDQVRTRRSGIAPTIGFGLGTDTRGTVGIFHLREDGIPDYGLPLVHGHMVPGVDAENFYGFRDLNVERTRTTIGTFRIEHDFSDEVTLRNQLRRSLNDRHSIVTPPREPRIAENDVRVNPTGRTTDFKSLTNQTDLTLRLGHDSDVAHTIVAGIELGREETDNQALTFPTPGSLGWRVSLTDPVFDFYPGTQANGDRTESLGKTLAVYAFDTIEIGEQWQLSGGVRHDRYDARSDLTTAAGVTTRSQREDTFNSVRAAVVYKPLPNGSIYFGYGTSFNPSAETGVLSSSPTASNPVALPPEENRSFELGTKWDLLAQRLQLSAAWFRTDKTNARTRELSTLPFALDGEQRVQGVELGAIGRISERWDVIAGYTYMDSEILESASVDPATGLPNEEGNPIGNTPKHSASLWTTYRFDGGWEIGVGAQHLGARTVSNTVTDELPAYTLFDAMVGWRASDHWDLRLNLLNLADKFYLERVHAGGSHGVPGSGRTAMLSINYTF